MPDAPMASAIFSARSTKSPSTEAICVSASIAIGCECGSPAGLKIGTPPNSQKSHLFGERVEDLNLPKFPAESNPSRRRDHSALAIFRCEMKRRPAVVFRQPDRERAYRRD